MLSLMCVAVTEVVVGVIVGVILVGGFGGYICYRIWAKKRGKCSCGCDCSKCSYSASCHSGDKDVRDKRD